MDVYRDIEIYRDIDIKKYNMDLDINTDTDIEDHLQQSMIETLCIVLRSMQHLLQFMRGNDYDTRNRK